ncbi:MAG TPA: hypothetical protein VGE67_15645 [Haloferula sp.]
MDRIAATTLHLELYRIAAGQPGGGDFLLERTYAICQSLYESAPTLDLLEQLRALRELMHDWTSPDGWQLHGQGPAVLREQLMECIDEVAELTGSSALEPGTPLLPAPHPGGAAPSFA